MTVPSEALAASNYDVLPVQLPVDILKQLRFSQYLCLAVLSAWVWDFAVNFDEEVLLVQRRNQRLSFTYFVYVASRFLSLSNTVLSAVIGSVKFDNCTPIIMMTTALATVSMPFSSFLMYCRVRAVYDYSVPVKTVFGILWLIVAGTSVGASPAVQGTSVGGRCLPTSVKSFGAMGILATAINDALIFLAISHRLLTFHSSSERWQDRMKGFLRGEGLSKLSKLLLQTGQIYYAATVGLYLLGVVGVMSPTLPAVFRAAFTIPTYTLTNNMACKVYRRTRLGLIKDDLFPATSARNSEAAFGSPVNVVLPRRQLTLLPTSESSSFEA